MTHCDCGHRGMVWCADDNQARCRRCIMESSCLHCRGVKTEANLGEAALGGIALVVVFLIVFILMAVAA